MKNDKSLVELGDRVRDTVTGFEGIASGISYFLTGCARVGVTPTDLDDGKLRAVEWFDDLQLVVIQRAAWQLPTSAEREPQRKTGGPRIDPPARGAPQC